MFTRRQLLAGAAAFPFVAALAGCAGTTAAGSALQQAISDAGLIATGLAGALKQLAAASFSAPILVKATTAVADIQAAVAALASAASATAAQPLVQRIGADVNAVVGVLAGLPLPAPVSTALTAASVLLPVIEAAVGIVVSAVAPHAQSAMTPAQARRALAALAGGAR